ncbi:hypothetical protein O0I10_002569 [Lichtheimia ornata]|uniref:Adhesion regulating molecule n=1 Tax=Lichtheimia ornata TaxID=688661 RepID=A0AAD7Y1R5_9FUNG|nr:uncharacterized protein O0I10_002569 [Lichtheimia ornata]KAJ8661761.1 hypothetical protein O0I10_002569 [Lichtheimia ornata]
MSLFPTAQRPKHLVQFNAGKCIREGNMLKPDLRKGTVYMDQSEDQLMHFYWKERKASTEPEEDLIIFPDEAEFVRVNECTTGRVYLLKFKSSNQKLFFWMQSKSDEKDEENVSRVNLLINDPQAAMESASGSSRMPGIDVNLGGNSPADMMQLLGGSDGISRENILQFLQTAGGFGGTIPLSVPSGGDGPVDQDQGERTEEHDSSNNRQSTNVTPAQLEQVRNALMGVQAPETQDTSITLSDNLISESLTPLINDSELFSALFPSITQPSGEQSSDQVRQLVSSQEFQRALSTLRVACENGELNTVASEIGLGSSAHNNFESLLSAFGEQAKRRQRERNSDAMEED